MLTFRDDRTIPGVLLINGKKGTVYLPWRQGEKASVLPVHLIAGAEAAREHLRAAGRPIAAVFVDVAELGTEAGVAAVAALESAPERGAAILLAWTEDRSVAARLREREVLVVRRPLEERERYRQITGVAARAPGGVDEVRRALGEAVLR
jgi:hypothetical protein